LETSGFELTEWFTTWYTEYTYPFWGGVVLLSIFVGLLVYFLLFWSLSADSMTTNTLTDGTARLKGGMWTGVTAVTGALELSTEDQGSVVIKTQNEARMTGC
jgi:hypothetical protein